MQLFLKWPFKCQNLKRIFSFSEDNTFAKIDYNREEPRLHVSLKQRWCILGCCKQIHAYEYRLTRLPCKEGKEELKNNPQEYTTQEGIEDIKGNPQVYTTQEGIEEINSNSQEYTTQEGIEEIKSNPQVYTTQEGIEEIKRNPQVYTTQESIEMIKVTLSIYYPRGYKRDKSNP